MKKFKILIILSVLSFSTGCQDSFLRDLPQKDTLLDENAIKTKLDLYTAVNGLYGKMLSATSFGADHFTYQELAADYGFVSAQNSGRFVSTNGYNHLRPEDGASVGIWQSIYSIVANANLILSYEGKIAESSDISQSVEQLFAHAHAVRAYCFFTLLGYFSPNYGEGDQTLGIPLPLKFDVYARLPRSSVAQSYEQVISDLMVAKDHFDEYYTNKNTFNTNSVNLLLARVYLAQKNYPKAIEYAQMVYDDPNSELLASNKVSQYFLLSSEDNFSETLFQLQQTSLNNLQLEAISGTWSSSGTYKQNFMTRDFWTSFPTQDVRRSFWYASNQFVLGLPDDPKPIDVRKYTSPGRDIVQFRKTEAVFILAEAQYQTNPTLASATLTNWVKTYRQPNYVAPATTGTGVLNEILRQKAFEFFLEGMRFFDQKRNHVPITKKVSNTFTLNVPANDYRFIWPIPLGEIQTNPNIKQAPGY